MSADFLYKNDPIYVSSANRQFGSSSDFTIDLTGQLITDSDYDAVVLHKFSCPKSYYLINSTNNTFILSENGVNNTITIPVGNYSFSSLKTALQTALSGHSFTYSVQADQATGKYTFNVSNVTGIQPSFIFNISSPHSIIGFEQGTYIFSSLTSSTGTLVSENIA